MMEKQTLTWDTTKDQTSKMACRICDLTTNHKVLSSVEAIWNWDDGNFDMQGNDRFEIVICLGCDTISFRHTSSNSEDIDLDPEGNTIYPEKESLYPNRIAGRKQIEHAYLLPDGIEKVYKETHGALCSQFNILAGIGIRALVESVCKEKNADGKDLEKKIEDIVLKGILTKDEAGILHKTRLLGNRSAHEIIEPKYEELEIAMDIIENLLRNAYIIPERAKRLKIGTVHQKNSTPSI